MSTGYRRHMGAALTPLADWLPLHRWPALPCGACATGTLTIDEPVGVETGRSKRLGTHEGWDPDWIEGFFTASARCANVVCHETAVVAGEMSVDAATPPYRQQAGYPPDQYETYYRLHYVEPALRIVKLFESCPGELNAAVRAASRVLFADPPSAAGRLRAAVEILLADIGIAEKGASGRRLPVHQRIEVLRNTRSDLVEVADLIEAVKWLGNAGSHTIDSPGLVDVLEGAELLERAIALVYDTSGARLLARAKQISTHRGPAPRP